jgi:hypothetical protein
VIDSQTRNSIANLRRCRTLSAVLEVDWVDGRPVFPGFPR